jgi:hypothetical protein
MESSDDPDHAEQNVECRGFDASEAAVGDNIYLAMCYTM